MVYCANSNHDRSVKFMEGLDTKIPKTYQYFWNKGGEVDIKIHMVFKVGLSKLHVCPHRGEGGSKISKNPSTWFMEVALVWIIFEIEVKSLHILGAWWIIISSVHILIQNMALCSINHQAYFCRFQRKILSCYIPFFDSVYV